uniref:Deoxynucleoside monophosphate kinase n=1 Tax=viral metagenome TaxID=1070528 RepID=A0A6C0KSR2_9ZZZZ
MLFVFVGNIGCGKTTAANILQKDFGFLEFSFASPLKDFALSIGFNFEDVYGSQEEKTNVNINFGISGRQFMQKFGTDIMRANSGFLFNNKIDNIWVKAMEIKISSAKNKNIVVSDGRFVDEIESLKKFGAIVVRLKRSNSPYTSCHSSEIEIHKIKADIEYENNSTIDALKSFISSLFSRFADISSKGKEEV